MRENVSNTFTPSLLVARAGDKKIKSRTVAKSYKISVIINDGKALTKKTFRYTLNVAPYRTPVCGRILRCIRHKRTNRRWVERKPKNVKDQRQSCKPYLPRFKAIK